MILTSANFTITPYVIPNQVDNAAAIDPFILAQEKELLIDLLGTVFYNALKAGIEALPNAWSAATTYAVDALVVSGTSIYKSLQAANLNHAVTDGAWWEEQAENKWLKLKVGETYLNSLNSFENEWQGLTALLTPAVYAQYLRHFPTTQTGIGLTVGNSENSEVVSPDAQICSAWNNYNRIASGGLYLNTEKDTLYGYLIANAEDFDEDVTGKGYDDFLHYLSLNFNCPDNMNVFGL